MLKRLEELEQKFRNLLNFGIIAIFLLVLLFPQGALGISNLDWIGHGCGETGDNALEDILTEACNAKKAEAAGIVFLSGIGGVFALYVVNRSVMSSSRGETKSLSKNEKFGLLMLVFSIAIVVIFAILANVE